MNPKSLLDSLTGLRTTARLQGLPVCGSDGCLSWPVWTCSPGKSELNFLPLPPPPSILLCDWTRPGAAAASSACQHSPSSPLSKLLLVRACEGCGSLREAAEDLSTVVRSLSEANKPSMLDMSGMQKIPHGLFTENTIENQHNREILPQPHRC